MQKTVFIVDDNDTNLAKAEEVLEEHYNVMTLPSGASMFKLIKRIVPDIILLDIYMPEMDGFEVLKQLKSQDEYKDIPVIFLTGLNDTASETKGRLAGAVDFIKKPFSEHELLKRVELQLRGA